MDHEMFTAKQRQQVGIGLGQLVELGYIQLNPEIKDANPLMYRPGTINVWCLALRDLSPGQIKIGFDILVSTWTMAFNRKPGPGDLREALNQRRAKDWSAIWNEVNERAHEFIYPEFDSATKQIRQPEWSSPMVAEVVRLLGGPAHILEEINTGELTTVRAQFRDVCSQVLQRVTQPGHTQLAPAHHSGAPMIAAPEPRALPALTGETPEQIIARTRKLLGMSDSSRQTLADKMDRAAEAVVSGDLTQAEAEQYVTALHKTMREKQPPAPPTRQKLVLPAEPPQGVGAAELIAGIAGAMAGKRKFG